MQVVTNEALVSSKAKVGSYTHWASMALLIVGFALSLPIGSDYFGQQTAIFAAYTAMVGAILLLNFGRTYTRRWGPRFRQDQWLILGLKGLDSASTLFNYASLKLPDHLLVAPSGLYVLLPRPHGGTINFDGVRWSRGSVTSGLIRGLGEGGLGDPVQEMRRALALLHAYLVANGSGDLLNDLPEPRPIIVFTNPSARLRIDNRHPGLKELSIIHISDLRAKFRRAKPVLSNEKVEELKQVFGRELAR